MIGLDRARAAEALLLVQTALAGIYSELFRLDSAVKGLRERWTGAAECAYDEAHAKWERQMRELHGIASALERQAGSAVATLHAADTAVRNLWR